MPLLTELFSFFCIVSYKDVAPTELVPESMPFQPPSLPLSRPLITHHSIRLYLDPFCWRPNKCVRDRGVLVQVVGFLSGAAREAHRSRTRRRPRPREVRCKPCGAGIVSTCSVGIAPRAARLEMLSGHRLSDANLGLKPWAMIFRLRGKALNDPERPGARPYRDQHNRCWHPASTTIRVCAKWTRRISTPTGPQNPASSSRSLCPPFDAMAYPRLVFV